MGKGTIVDATIINAPSSTTNAEKKRDPQMHQTRKGKQWYFGMKMHTGVDDGFEFYLSFLFPAGQASTRSTKKSRPATTRRE